MAELKPGPLGTPIGKHGKTVFRRNRKKIFTYELSDEPMKVKSEKAQNNRNEFGKLIKFSNFINKTVVIKLAWKKVKVPGVASNRRIFKYNHNTFKFAGINSRCHILPASIYMSLPEVFLDENRLSFQFSTCDSYWKTYNEQYSDFNPPYVFIAMIYAKDPVNPDCKNKVVNVMMQELSDDGPFPHEGIISFTFDTSEKSFTFINDYNTVLVFPAVICLNEYNQPYKWTETGGIYIKGSRPVYTTSPEDKTIENPEKSFRIEYD